MLAAGPEVALEVSPAAPFRDCRGAGRCAADGGAGLDRQAEHVAEDEDGPALRGEAAEGAEQATAPQLGQEHAHAPDVAPHERVAQGRRGAAHDAAPLPGQTYRKVECLYASLPRVRLSIVQ